MKNQEKMNTRRNFLKGALINGAAISSLPFISYAEIKNHQSMKMKDDTIPRLPLRIMMAAGLSDKYKQKLESISPDITLLTPGNSSSIEKAEAWFGSINREQFLKAKNLKWMQSPSAGVEHYLFPEMVDSDVRMTNAKGCYGPAIAEHTIGLLFSLTRKLVSQTRNMARGNWQREEDMAEMKGMTMGIVGLGGIGSQVARRARAMDMQVIAVDIVPKYKEQIGDICDEVRLIQDEGLDWLLPNSDVVVCATPHTKVSEGMFGREQFNMMSDGAWFINVSRGKLVQTPFLVEALKTGKLSGAGLDVTDPEPLPSDHELWKIPNVIITSHIAARSQYSGERMNEVFVENVHRYIHGFPLLNQVDKEMGF
jgi:phosphoglycerate dehydrogenase-like enzyme